MLANSAYDKAAQALATPAIRNEKSTPGPADSLATAPAREKIPAPMMPPIPMAVSCHRPSVRCRPSPPSDSMSSIGFRRRNAARTPDSDKPPPPRDRAGRPSAPGGQRPQEECDIGRSFGQSTHEVAVPLRPVRHVHAHPFPGGGQVDLRAGADAVEHLQLVRAVAAEVLRDRDEPRVVRGDQRKALAGEEDLQAA